MKRLIGLSVTAFSLALAGCGEESDQLPVDGRDFDGVEYSEPAPYTGKVIDGYLNNARVWLDMDGDSQFTPGPLAIELDNGETATLDSGEPTAMSGPGGQFSLDISELVLEPAIGPDIDPRDYPIYAVALPGKTLEETRSGDVPVANAYLMSAPPGVRNVTPLTTLARYRGLVGLGSFLETPAGAAASLADLNLVRDYILAQDDRSHAYARALARFMASQIPDGYNDLLVQEASNGTERFLSKEAAFLLGLSLVQNAGDVIAVVDAAAQGGYANVDVSALDLPQVSVELRDPVLLTLQRIFAESSNQDLPALRSGLQISAELSFDYNEGGQLMSVSANGCLAPSMPELARLVTVNGHMANLETQWLPAVALSGQSRMNYDIEGIDERLTFDWDNQRIYFETSTTCHKHAGIVAGSTELGGNPEIVYSWTRQDGGLVELQANYASGVTRTLIPAFTNNASQVFPGYRILEDGVARETVALTSDIQYCIAKEDAAGAGQVVTGYQGYEFSGYEPQPADFTDLLLEFDTRKFSGSEHSNTRLLRYGFMDPALSDLSRVTGDGSFEWAMNYFAADAPGFIPEQPNLVRDAFLTRFSSVGDCGRKLDELPSSAYAHVEYRYQRLSEYLVGLLE
jgi:hypothetical protein